MKVVAIFGLIAGLILATILIVSNGADGVWHSITLVGLSGFAAVTGFHLCLIVLMGTAWWLLTAEHSLGDLPRFIWGRLVRDSGSEVLPLSQIGGYVFGTRAVALSGIKGAFAAASTVVDVTAELIAQLIYTLGGLVLLYELRPDAPFVRPVLTGLVIMSILAAVFIAIQARGAGYAERIGKRFASEFLGRDLGESGAVQAGIQAIHRRRGALILATAVHLLSWVLSGVETWLTLRLMGMPITIQDALIVDSLLYGIRSIAFMVPNSIGVQEGALILLGSLFGISADTALALSLIKRARDITIGAPTLLAWQLVEGRRAWARNGAMETASQQTEL